MSEHDFITKEQRRAVIERATIVLGAKGVTIEPFPAGSLSSHSDGFIARRGGYFCRVIMRRDFRDVVIPWNCDSGHSFPRRFPQVNGLHFCKAIQVERSAEDLIKGLLQRFELLQGQKVAA